MPQLIQVPGKGVVSFPDNMTDDEITTAIQKDMSQTQTVSSVSPQQQSQSENSNPSLLPRLGADVVTGLAQMGHGLLNAPHNLANVVSPRLASYIPHQADYNFGQMLGVNDPNIGDKLLQGATQYAPYALGGETAGASSLPTLLSRLGAQAGIGGVYGATQSDNPVSGAAVGAAGNAAFGLGGKAISAVGNIGKNYLSQFAGDSLVNQIGNTFSNVKNITNQNAFDLAKQNFQKYQELEKPLWENVKNIANNVDSSGTSFDNTSYIDALNRQLEKLRGQSSRQSAFDRANKDSIDMLEGYGKDQTGTFSDAIEHNKALNQDYQNEITPGKSLPFSTVNYAKSNLQKALQENLNQEDPLIAQLKESLTNANKITQQKNQIFNQVVNTGGKTQNSKFATFLSGKNENADPSSFVNDYVPNGRADGIQKMQQFSQMLGDEENAKNVIKQNYFDKVLTDDGVEPKAFLKKYNNLSAEQKEYLFNSDEMAKINSLSKVLKAHPNALDKSAFTYALHNSIPALFGASVSGALGHGWESGAIAGAIGYPFIQTSLKKAFSNPAVADYFVNSLDKGSVQPNSYLGSLSSALAQGATTPNLVNQYGGK
jgi:hypothetical protein